MATTPGYARLYDATVAADYCRAVAQVEQRFAGDGDAVIVAPSVGELVAMVDSLRTGTLNQSQQRVVQALRAGILSLEETGRCPTHSPGCERRCRRSACAAQVAVNSGSAACRRRRAG